MGVKVKTTHMSTHAVDSHARYYLIGPKIPSLPHTQTSDRNKYIFNSTSVENSIFSSLLPTCF